MTSAAMEGQSLAVRPARQEDLAAVAAVLDAGATATWDRATLAHELGIAWSRVLVLDYDGQVAALAVYWLVVDEVQLLHIATHAAHRRRGLARRLLLNVVSEARRRGARRMLLEVRPSNTAARSLYVATGFTETGVRPRYYADGEDAVLMRLEPL